MTQTRARLTTASLGTAATAALVVGLAGCTPAEGDTAAPPTVTTTVTATDAATTAAPSATPEEALVTAYLDAIVAGDTATAWPLLSTEAQASYGSEATFAEYSPTDGTVTAEEAGQLLAGSTDVVEGPEGAFTLVSITTDSEADAWIVRETADGLRLDDAGVPPTGESLYTWSNPDVGAEDGDVDPVAAAEAVDPAAPARLSFASPASADATAPSVVGYPSTVWAWIDGEPVEVPEPAAAGSGRTFDVPLGGASTDGAPRGLTVAWQTGDDSLGWRSSTVLL